MKHYLFYVAQNYSYAILRPLQDEIRRRGDKVAWFFEGDEVDTHYLHNDEVRLTSLWQVWHFKPVAVFAPGNFIPSFFPGLKVALFHGFNSGKRSDEKGHFRIRGCFDLYCTQGPNTTGPFKQLELKHGFFDVVETGWCALDPLHKVEQGKQGSRPTVLLCSTFSKNLTCAPHIYEEVKRLSQDSRWEWLVQFHPKMDKVTVDAYKALQNDNLTFVETDNVLPLLHQADVMVCDTSSVMLMFLLLGKPIVAFNNASKPDYYLNIDSASQLSGAIERALTLPASLMTSIHEHALKTHPYRDGRSAMRVLNAVENILTQGKRAKRLKPFNLLRNIKKIGTLVSAS